MLNKDVEGPYEYANNGMTVSIIYVGPYGPFKKGLVALKSRDRGVAVLEVQRKMKERDIIKGT